MEMTLEVSWERTLSVLFDLYFTGYDAYLFLCVEILNKWKNFLIPETKLELSSIGFDSGKESSSFFCLKVFHINFHSIGFYIFLNFEISTVQMEGFLLSNPEIKEVTLYQVGPIKLIFSKSLMAKILCRIISTVGAA